MRENTAGTITHPAEMPSGAWVLTDPRQMDEILDRLQNGDPTRGWEGDPRLVLAFDRPAQTWELWRLESDEQYRLVAKKSPWTAFPGRIIEELVEHDRNRGYDVEAVINAANAARDAKIESAAADRTEDFARKLRWALRKDDV